jgi:Pentapeptide repeats (8 copies)
LWRAQLQGAFLWGAWLRGAFLGNAQLQGATLAYADLQGAYLRDAQLQGATLAYAAVGSADFSHADLTWSALRGLSQAPLDEKMYGVLEKSLTDAISDTDVRAKILGRLHDAIGRPTDLSAARAETRSVLCDNVDLFHFCVTQAQSTKYADDRARFLVTLGCEGKDAVIARGIIRIIKYGFIPGNLPPREEDRMWVTFAKHVIMIPEKDCPGWAALPADQKENLRKLAVEQPSARKGAGSAGSE